MSESVGKLFCKARRENIAVKRSVVQNYIKSRKYAESKEKLKERVARELDIAKALQAHDAEMHRKGETLPIEHNIYRLKLSWHS